MSNDLGDLLRQRQELEAQIARLQSESRKSAIAEIRRIMAENNISVADLGAEKKPARAGNRAKVAPKYRDPVSGATWTGRGLAPKWMQGRSRDEFLIAA